MGKLIMWNLVTLDGFFEGAKNWDLDWHHIALDDDFFRFCIEQLQSADLLVFGRVTYEGMAAHWPKADGEIAENMNRIPKIVFSRTLKHAEWANTSVIADDPRSAIAALKQVTPRNIFIFGSADLSAHLIDAGLFDEYRLGFTSIILRHGRPLFREGTQRMNLKLIESRQLSAGCVLARYAPEPPHR
jgi:dihydrofolate reductase